MLLFVSQITFGQTDINPKIDSGNYYNYFSKGENLKGTDLTIDNLTINDAVPVIMDELKKAGYEWLYEYSLYKIDSSHHLVLSVYCRKSNFGFLYITGHGLPSKEDRLDLTQNNDYGADYISIEETPSEKPNRIAIKKIPDNIFLLNETCYWFEHTNNIEDNKVLLTKETAIKIHRQDINKYLVRLPKR
jgi:hypothetical protein